MTAPKYVAMPTGEHTVVFDQVHVLKGRGLGLVVAEAKFVTPLREDQLVPASPALVKLLVRGRERA